MHSMNLLTLIGTNLHRSSTKRWTNWIHPTGTRSYFAILSSAICEPSEGRSGLVKMPRRSASAALSKSCASCWLTEKRRFCPPPHSHFCWEAAPARQRLWIWHQGSEKRHSMRRARQVEPASPPPFLIGSVLPE